MFCMHIRCVADLTLWWFGAVCSIQLVSPASSHSPSPFHSLLKLWQPLPPPQAQVLPSIFVLSFEVVPGVATSTADQVSRI